MLALDAASTAKEEKEKLSLRLTPTKRMVHSTVSLGGGYQGLWPITNRARSRSSTAVQTRCRDPVLRSKVLESIAKNLAELQIEITPQEVGLNFAESYGGDIDRIVPVTRNQVESHVPAPVARIVSNPFPAPAPRPVPGVGLNPVPAPAVGPVPAPLARPVPAPLARPVPVPIARPVPAVDFNPVPAPAVGPVLSPLARDVPAPAVRAVEDKKKGRCIS
jgi:hypothetical protein